MIFFKRHTGNICATEIILLIVFLVFHPAVRAETTPGQTTPAKIVAVGHCDYVPISFLDKETNKLSGFFVDIMDAIARNSGLQVQYICRNGWPEMISTIESGEADLGVLLKSVEREKKLLFSAPIDMTYLSFFARSQSSADAYEVPATGYTVGVVKGSMSNEHLKNRPGLRLQAENSYEEGIFKLLAGETDLFAGEDTSILKAARGAGLDNRIKKVGKPFVERERGLAVQKNNVRLLEMLNKSLTGFIGSSEYQRIYIKWYGAPAPYWTIYRILFAGGMLLFIVVCGMVFWRYQSITRLNAALKLQIAERKQAEETAREKGRFIESIVNLSPDMLYIYDLVERRNIYSNAGINAILGYSPEEVHIKGDKLIPELMHPDDFQVYIEKIVSRYAQAKDGEQITHQFRMKNKSGEWRWLDCAEIIYQREPDGSPQQILGVVHDVTERKHAEEKIQQSEEYIRNILDTVDEGFLVVGRDYRIKTANKAYCKQVGLSSDEVVGRFCYEVSHLTERPCFEEGECPVREVFATGIFHKAGHNHVNRDGEVLFVEIKAFPNKDEAGHVVSAIEVIHNITERHLLEAEQLKTQKLEAVGTLAGGIAHDFNNLLQGLFGNISMAKLCMDQPEKVFKFLDQAEKALSMSVNLTTQLLTFAKGGKPVIKRTDIGPVIENTSKFALSGSKCDYRLAIAQDLWHAEADDGQIGQVIQNIVLNANEAMPDGGIIDISAGNMDIPNGSNMLLPNGGKFIKLVIQDTGTGIPEEHVSRIFDPYFTTKQKGSGLGLATSYSIIKNHGGAIEVLSKPGSGTTFFIYLPATATKAEESVQVSWTSPTRKRRILVMDDEAIVLEVSKNMIEALGHDVDVATDGESATEKYRQALASDNPFDVIILDLTVKGGMGGEETVKRLREMDPSVRAVVASGYSDNPVLLNFKAHGFSAVLSKPFSLAALRECLGALVS